MKYWRGDVRGSLDEFEVKIRRYERSCNDVLSDRVKIAVVQKGIEDDDLRRHLLMHAARLETYPLVREEIRSIITARDTLTGPAPMDIGAVQKGKEKGRGKKGKNKSKGKGKNKSKGKGKEKEKRRTQMQSYFATTVTGKVTGSVTASGFERDRDKKGVNAVDQAPGLTPGAAGVRLETPSRVSMIELDDWILAVSLHVHEDMVGSVERVMVDSGAAVSVCLFGHAPEIPMINQSVKTLDPANCIWS